MVTGDWSGPSAVNSLLEIVKTVPDRDMTDWSLLKCRDFVELLMAVD